MWNCHIARLLAAKNSSTETNHTNIHTLSGIQIHDPSTWKTADPVVTDQQNSNMLYEDNVNFNSG
jgi:hypothetical protein